MSITYDFLQEPSWSRRLGWFGAAFGAHALTVVLFICLVSVSTQRAPEIFSVSLIASPPAPTPPAPAPQPRPVVKQTPVKAIKAPLPAPTDSKTAISQEQPVASPDTSSNSSQVASGNSKPNNEVYVEPRANAAHLNNPAPPYPALSRRLGETGTVSLRVYVSAAGRPEKVELHRSSGFSRLDVSALDTVKNEYRFVPARLGDTPVAGWVTFPVVFKLN